MATLGYEVDDPGLAPSRGETGPVSKARQRRTRTIYLTLLAIGILPWLLGASASWQAAGLGLWLPGAGFLALGGWWSLMFPLVLALFVLALIAWFWSGMLAAPLAVWSLSLFAAAALAGDSSWAGAPFVAAGAVVAIGLFFARRNRKGILAGRKRATARESFLPQSLAEVSALSRATPDSTTRELTTAQLSGLRYLLDRALQPVEGFDGFTIIDQFQPAALRYQLNHMGFALAIAQTAYVPNFRGYMGVAQRNLIEKYLQKRVWDYWVLESCWGHFNFTDWDPAKRDNIMLTAWFGAHVGGYMLATGDRRYLQPGSLSFRLNDNNIFQHDFTTIIGSVVQNYETAEFGHYACEPNWIYPICNHYGMLSLVTHDAILGSNHVERFLPNWFDKLDTEFTDASGSIIGLRSQLTGLPVPFPVGEAGYSHFENTFAPARARRLWAIARREIEPLIVDEADGPRLQFRGSGLDAGNYKSGHTGSYGSYLLAAREFGDQRIADAAQKGLERDCAPNRDNGVLSYRAGSNLTNVAAITGLLMDTGDFRRTFTQGPDKQTLAGPMIETLDYPAVLLARAYSADGRGLDAVFYPGTASAAGVHAVPLSQLIPGQRYALTGARESEITADANGMAEFHVELRGRTEVHLHPLQS